MNILLTGATGYIGGQLLPVLVNSGHKVICPVRNKTRFNQNKFSAKIRSSIEVYEVDFLDEESLGKLPADIDVAYYLLHSMSSGSGDFRQLEETVAHNFSNYIKSTSAKQIIYLGGIANDSRLSRHLNSRIRVEEILKATSRNLTVLRAGIIIGAGSASFEIIRDLVEKLPVMIAPRWLNSKCQPIAMSNMLEYLSKCLGHPDCYNHVFDIGGPDILTYKQMLLGYAQFRGLNRKILTIPVLTPRLSSWWLYFVTSTSFQLARHLVDSIKNDVVCKDEKIKEIISLEKMYNYMESLEETFSPPDFKKSVNHVEGIKPGAGFIPDHGIFKDEQIVPFDGDPQKVVENIWNIGGKRGWYYGNFLWRIRGFIDKLFGGVGLRKGISRSANLKRDDLLDFWKVVYADKDEMKLQLFAEMRLPGEAWLEFNIQPGRQNAFNLCQIATFRPLGVRGRLYWYLMLPFHHFIFRGMAKNIVEFGSSKKYENGY